MASVSVTSTLDIASNIWYNTQFKTISINYNEANTITSIWKFVTSLQKICGWVGKEHRNNLQFPINKDWNYGKLFVWILKWIIDYKLLPVEKTLEYDTQRKHLR